MRQLTKTEAFILKAQLISLSCAVIGLIGVFAFDAGLLHTISGWVVSIAVASGVIFGVGSFFALLESSKDREYVDDD